MEIVLSAITVVLLGYQSTMMPELQNAKWSPFLDRNGNIIKMNTQTGEMIRCTDQLVCEDSKDRLEPIVKNTVKSTVE